MHVRENDRKGNERVLFFVCLRKKKRSMGFKKVFHGYSILHNLSIWVEIICMFGPYLFSLTRMILKV